MFGRAVRLFKLSGFEVRADASWLIIAGLVAWSLGGAYFPAQYPHLPQQNYWWMGVAGAVGLFASIVVHEFSHSVVARRLGLPMKGITLFLFGGVAEMGDEPANARTEFLMAIAGPAASMAIGAAAYLAYFATAGGVPVVVTGVLKYLGGMNFLLAIFNMIPAFPLDGGRVLRSVLWRWKGDLRGATRTASALGSGFGMLLILFAVWQWLMGNFVGALWYFLIGLFLRGAAQSSYQQLLIRSALEGQPVRRFMNAHPVAVPSYISIEDLVDDYVYRYHHKMFPVLNPVGKLAGCVTTNEVKGLPRDEWDRHSVQELLQPRSEDNTVEPDVEAVKALAKMNSSGQSRLMVAEGEHLAGVISLKDLMGFLADRMELEGSNFHDRFHPAHP